jgi:arylsulfatase A-like enzyme
MSRRPHIVIFNPDQWRADVMGHFGNPAALTPTLDRAVQTDFVSFRNAFCQNPVCTPSRCSFMTGWYPHTRGHRTMHHGLHDHEPELLRTLKENGYHVWWGGKNDLVAGQLDWRLHADELYRAPGPVDPLWGPNWGNPPGRAPGDDLYYSFYVGRQPHTPGHDHYHDWDWANVLGAVERIRNPPRDKPLCIYLPIVYPHPPYAVEDAWYSAVDRRKLPPRTRAPEDWSAKPSILRGIRQTQNLTGWTEERWDELRATYYGMCGRVDHQFSLILQALRDAGLYDDTAVFLFSDHGDFTGDYDIVEKTQNTFEDCLTRVPFLVKPPAGVPCRPRVSEALVELIDFPATVEALTGIQPRHTHFGRSLLPVLAGETDEHRDAVFCEGGRLLEEQHTREAPSVAKMDPQRPSLYWPRIQFQVGNGPEHGKAAMVRTRRYKYVRRLYEQDELYDLQADPGERCNRSADPALAAVRAELSERLLRWYMETCDDVPFHQDDRGFK